MEGLKRFGLARRYAHILLISGLITGCASTPDYKYYRLQAEIPQQSTIAIHTAQSIGLEPVSLPVWMDSELLAWNEGSYNIRRLEFDRWAGEPKDLVDQTLSENLSYLTGGREITIGPWFASNRPDLVVDISIQNLSLVNDRLTLKATWDIKDKSRKTIDFNEKYTDTVVITTPLPVSGRSMAQGVSKLLANLSQAVVKALSKQP